MIIIGADVSITSPAFIRYTLDDDYNIVGTDWLAFKHNSAKKKKMVPEYDNIKVYGNFDNYIDRSIYLHSEIYEWVCCDYSPEYFAIEDYAFGAIGKSFHIGGFTEPIKTFFYQLGSNIRMYDLTCLKKFLSHNGNADKVSMGEAFNKLENPKIDISKLKDFTNPKEDIIDAYACIELLLLELKLRKGIITLKELSENDIWIFNRVTRISKENILTKEFIKKQ